MKTFDRPAPETHEKPNDKAPDNQSPNHSASATDKPKSVDKKAAAKKKRLALMIGVPVLLIAGIIGYRTSALIRRVAAGRTVLMVEHNLSVVAELSDRITVLARGEVLAEGDYAAVSQDPEVIEAYVGAGHG